MSQPQKKQQSVSDQARSRTATPAEVADGTPAKKKAKGKASPDDAKAGFNRSALPEQYANDEKIAERQAAFEANGPVTTVNRDAWEGTIERILDDDEHAPDPMEEAVDQIRQPGKAYRILSPRVMNRRGKRGWELERDKDGKPIELPGSGQLIGSMPMDAAIKRNKKFQQASIDAVAQANDQYNELAERLEHDSEGTVSVLKRGEMVRDNNPRNQGRGGAAVIGAESFRG